MEKMATVYYTVTESGISIVFVTKEYYMQTHSLDSDGSSADTAEVSRALTNIGCAEFLMPRHYLDISEEKMITKMRDYGYEMVRNDNLI